MLCCCRFYNTVIVVCHDYYYHEIWIDWIISLSPRCHSSSGMLKREMYRRRIQAEPVKTCFHNRQIIDLACVNCRRFTHGGILNNKTHNTELYTHSSQFFYSIYSFSYLFLFYLNDNNSDYNYIKQWITIQPL